jgi:putative Ca2+/H+ antiporter (TMEM165/GDT1 family)
MYSEIRPTGRALFFLKRGALLLVLLLVTVQTYAVLALPRDPLSVRSPVRADVRSEERANRVRTLANGGGSKSFRQADAMTSNRKQLAQAKLVMKELRARSFSVATYQSLGMILVTELGDKTFFIAAVLAARHSRFTVLQGALSALLIMTVLSALLGRTFPKLFSPKYTSILAGFLFLYFGVQMIRDYWRLCQKRNRAHDEADDEPVNGLESQVDKNGNSDTDWQALEEKLARERERPGRSVGNESGVLPDQEIQGDHQPADIRSSWLGRAQERLRVLEAFAQMCFSPLFLRAFTLTFLAEWGDRSQIATIALAAHRNLHGVVLGATFGHLLCTGLAVVGGRLVAHKIPERFIALCGGVLFLIFGILSFCTDHAEA